MKKLLLNATLLFALSFATKAQQYVPFPTSNATWTDVVVSRACESAPLDTTAYPYSLYGDSTVGNKIYQKINFFDGTTTLIREESKYIILSKSYLSNGQPDTLFNFNLNIGDVWHNKTCQSIDSILINGTYRKRFNMGTNNGIGQGAPSPTLYWIEGIGSTAGLFTSLMLQTLCLDNYYSYNLACLQVNNLNSYSWDGFYNCDGVVLSLPQPDTAKNTPTVTLPQGLRGVNIFPNPTLSKEIHINNIDTKYGLTAKITDYTGRVVLTQKLDHADNTIKLSNSGQLYILIILDHQGQAIKSQKIYNQ